MLVVAYFIMTTVFSTQPAAMGKSAREIDPQCDVVLFTTPSCGYCKKAKKLLKDTDVAWCEKDINYSQENKNVFHSLGGRGVPLMVAGDKILKGYERNAYLSAIQDI